MKQEKYFWIPFLFWIILTRKAPVTSAADDILNFFLFFKENKFTFHVNRLVQCQVDLFSLKK